jgi:hypothetical protein
MGLTDFLPFRGSSSDSFLENLDPEERKEIGRAMRVLSLGIGQNQNAMSFSGSRRRSFESPDQDLSVINSAIDTDGYAKQAFSKYKELFWKQGWEIISENPDATDYLWQRIDYLEIAMNRPFQEFLEEAVDQYVKMGNVFIAKSRGDIAPFFPGKLRSPEGRKPIAGYYVLPTETIEIFRTRNNRITKYRQNTALGESSFAPKKTMPSWKAEDVIHMHTDRKPGRAFGTPFVTAALEDIVGLRQMEEDIQNLVHRELFPLYKYKIGTDERPASKADIDEAELELADLRSEGGLIMPHHHDLEIIGGQENVLDAAPYLAHFKERVAMGLGVFPHHLGMSSEGGNRSVTDRLDAALYDRIKHMQRLIAENIRFSIFNELLWEGGFDPYINPNVSNNSDRCVFRYNEIDVDTLVKSETHIIQKYTANLIDTEEARLQLKLKPDLDESKTLAAMQARLMPDVVQKGADGAAPNTMDTTPSAAQKPSTGGKANTPNKSKGASNLIRPTNQQGTRTSPNIRRSDNRRDIMENEIIDLLDEEE